MNTIATKIKTEQKQRITFSRVLTNKMTICGWRLFSGNRNLHLSFIIYRLKKDFGFTHWEIANFTGIPVKDVENFLRRTKKVLNAEILKILANMDWIEEEHKWRVIPNGHGREQGYFVKKTMAWYDESKYRQPKRKPSFKSGGESEN